tara:strand:+ start:465 stop:929 length:465 start_codon:yes stop_codon:yes gene_type:complete
MFSSPDGARPSTSRSVARPSPQEFADYVVPSPKSDVSNRPEVMNFGFEAAAQPGRAVTPPISDVYGSSGKLNFDKNFDFEEDAESSTGYVSRNSEIDEYEEEDLALEDNIFIPERDYNNTSYDYSSNAGDSAVSDLERNYAMQGRVLLSIALSL